jgi:hypothetical protein
MTWVSSYKYEASHFHFHITHHLKNTLWTEISTPLEKSLCLFLVQKCVAILLLGDYTSALSFLEICGEVLWDISWMSKVFSSISCLASGFSAIYGNLLGNFKILLEKP